MNAIGFSEKKKMLIKGTLSEDGTPLPCPHTHSGWINQIIWSTQQTCIYSSKILFVLVLIVSVGWIENVIVEIKSNIKISLKEYPEYCGHILKSRAIIRVGEYIIVTHTDIKGNNFPFYLFLVM